MRRAATAAEIINGSRPTWRSVWLVGKCSECVCVKLVRGQGSNGSAEEPHSLVANINTLNESHETNPPQIRIHV